MDEKLLDALDSVVWYNGHGDFVIKWLELEPDEYGTITFDQAYGKYDASLSIYYPLQMLWMIAVSLFGDYGTSPRSGWIEDIEGFRQFVKRICKTQLEDWGYE